MNNGMYRVELHVTIPARRPSGRVVWVPAPTYENVSFTDLVRGPDECGRLAEAMATHVGRVLLAEDATGFRIAVRGKTSRFLCALGEWHRRNTGPFENAYVWSASWDDVPPACVARLRPEDGFEAAPQHLARLRPADDCLAA
jgi:hypothetical protein